MTVYYYMYRRYKVNALLDIQDPNPATDLPILAWSPRFNQCGTTPTKLCLNDLDRTLKSISKYTHTVYLHLSIIYYLCL